ncbi:MAG: glycerophosphodiester phosphodiesterase, partial [Candidatus Binatia bacterium]
VLERENCVGSLTVDEIQASCLPVNGAGQTATEAGLTPTLWLDEERVPTLEQSLAAIFAEKPDAIVNIEIKSQPPTDFDSAKELCSSGDPEHRSTELTVQLLDERFVDYKDQIIISSFDPTAVELAERLDESLDVGYLSLPANQAPRPAPALPTAAEGAVLAAAFGLDSLHPNERDTTLAVVDLAHGLGLTVRPWTVNDRCEMRRLIDLGVDAIITDDPLGLAEELSSPSVCP